MPNLDKPKRGDLLVGRIQKSLRATLPPSLMVSLRGGYVGRACITELDESDEWTNMPIGSASVPPSGEKQKKKPELDAEDSGGDDEDSDDDEQSQEETDQAMGSEM